MPRGPRLDAEGVLQHVVARGIEKREIFRSDADREDFVDRLAKLAPETGTAIYAWSLMPNHFHLLARSGPEGLSRFMRRLQTGYAGAFNRRYQRSGHLYQDRFKSIMVEEDKYLLELLRYVHLNPLRAGLVRTVRSLDSYPWSGHAVLVGKREAPWQDTEQVLLQFGRARGRAVRAYRQFISDGVSLRSDVLEVPGDQRRAIAEDRQGPESRARREREAEGNEKALGRARFLGKSREGRGRGKGESGKRGGTDMVKELDEVLRRVGKERGLRPEAIRGPSRAREVSEARARVAHDAVLILELPGTEVARYLSVSSAAVSQMVNRAAKKKLKT